MEEQKIDKKKKSRLKIAAAIVLGTILLIVAGAGLGFLYLRFQGERSLKSQVQIMDANMENRENTSEDSISEE